VIVLFTDFGVEGPYAGQMEAILRQKLPNTAVIHLLHNAPAGQPELAAYLLAALRHDFPPGSIFLSVVDPGVGGKRGEVVVKADGQYFIGPENGLFNTVARHSLQRQWWNIHWRPESCSNSFHGRDIFAPVAAALVADEADRLLRIMPEPDLSQWPQDLAKIIYFDHYGNAMTGLRYQKRWAGCSLRVQGKILQQADTFCQAEKGQAFWYKNANGLVEIAVNRGHAQKALSLGLGDTVTIESGA